MNPLHIQNPNPYIRHTHTHIQTTTAPKCHRYIDRRVTETGIGKIVLDAFIFKPIKLFIPGIC